MQLNVEPYQLFIVSIYLAMLYKFNVVASNLQKAYNGTLVSFYRKANGSTTNDTIGVVSQHPTV